MPLLDFYKALRDETARQAGPFDQNGVMVQPYEGGAMKGYEPNINNVYNAVKNKYVTSTEQDQRGQVIDGVWVPERNLPAVYAQNKLSNPNSTTVRDQDGLMIDGVWIPRKQLEDMLAARLAKKQVNAQNLAGIMNTRNINPAPARPLAELYISN